MNREQYLAKRMRLCGTPPDAGNGAGLPDVHDSAGTALAPAFSPAVSLVEHYRRLHSGIAGATAGGKPN
jgi:hypothetical protein